METSKLKAKKPIIIVIAVFLLLCCLCFTVLGIIGANSAPEIRSLNSNSDNWEAENQTEYLKFACTYVSNISINNNKLTSDQVSDACKEDKGYAVKLQDGSNTFKVEVSNLSQNSSKTLELTVGFDLQKYQVKIAKEEELRKQQELADAEKLKQKQLAQQQKEADLKATQQAQANKPKIGDSLSGPSFEEIKSTYNEQNNLSAYKGMQYLESLKGQQIVWVGEISDVDKSFLGSDIYIALHLSTGIIQNNIAFVYDPKSEYLQLNKGTVVKVTGKIKEVNTGFLGWTVYIDRNATFEVIN